MAISANETAVIPLLLLPLVLNPFPQARLLHSILNSEKENHILLRYTLLLDLDKYKLQEKQNRCHQKAASNLITYSNNQIKYEE